MQYLPTLPTTRSTNFYFFFVLLIIWSTMLQPDRKNMRGFLTYSPLFAACDLFPSFCSMDQQTSFLTALVVISLFRCFFQIIAHVPTGKDHRVAQMFLNNYRFCLKQNFDGKNHTLLHTCELLFCFAVFLQVQEKGCSYPHSFSEG